MQNTDVVKRELPTLQDLIEADNLELMKKQDALNYLLNQPTPRQWVKKHPIINIKVGEDQQGRDIKEALEYVPVERIKLTLTMIYGGFQDEIIDVKQIFNAVAVVVRLKVIDPTTGKEIIHDGVGAVGVQTDKGASASDLGAIKQDAVTKALPAAASYALKNAAEKLGIIFGGGLQKYDLQAFTPVYNDELKDAIIEDRKAKFAASAQKTNQ